jgi:hypothetical protein
MSPAASVVIILVSSLYLIFTFRFWYIAQRRGILRETLNCFHYEAVIDLILFVLYGLQIYLLVQRYAGMETQYDWIYSLGGFIAFVVLALKKVARISLSGIAHAKAVSSEFDQVMDGIEIKKNFRKYMNEVSK